MPDYQGSQAKSGSRKVCFCVFRMARLHAEFNARRKRCCSQNRTGKKSYTRWSAHSFWFPSRQVKMENPAQLERIVVGDQIDNPRQRDFLLVQQVNDTRGEHILAGHPRVHPSKRAVQMGNSPDCSCAHADRRPWGLVQLRRFGSKGDQRVKSTEADVYVKRREQLERARLANSCEASE